MMMIGIPIKMGVNITPTTRIKREKPTALLFSLSVGGE